MVVVVDNDGIDTLCELVEWYNAMLDTFHCYVLDPFDCDKEHAFVDETRGDTC